MALVRAVAVRSVRGPEARAGLAAVIGVIEAAPQLTEAVRRFLLCDDPDTLTQLKAQMQQAANELDYERAGVLRDGIANLEWLLGTLVRLRTTRHALAGFPRTESGGPGQGRHDEVRRRTGRGPGAFIACTAGHWPFNPAARGSTPPGFTKQS